MMKGRHVIVVTFLSILRKFGLAWKSDVFKSVIGMEVHVQLNTQTKLLCDCPNEVLSRKANSCVCPTCLGLPGSLPMLNQAAVGKAVSIAKALRCSFEENLEFSRKSYFYPDLPKNFQITQTKPLGSNGKFYLMKQKEKTEIQIKSVILEEDTARIFHPPFSTKEMWIDNNRAGVPLVEIVSEPVMSSAEETVDFTKELVMLLVRLNVSTGVLAHGSLRFDLNISQNYSKTTGENSQVAYPRIEVKNLNSFRALRKALVYEERRQRCDISEKKKSSAATSHVRRWNAVEKRTERMRPKYLADRYRFQTEWNIPPISLSTVLNELSAEKNSKLPVEIYRRYEEELQLDQSDARLLVSNSALGSLFDNLLLRLGSSTTSAQSLAKWTINVVAGVFSDCMTLAFSRVNDLVIIFNALQTHKITHEQAAVQVKHMTTNQQTAVFVKSPGNTSQQDQSQRVDAMARHLIRSHPKEVELYKKGNQRMRNFFVAEVKKITSAASSKSIGQIVDDLLNSSEDSPT